MMTTVPTISKVLDKKRKVILNGFIDNYLRFSRSSEYTKFIFHISKLVRIFMCLHGFDTYSATQK